jgi:hypothetical protein
MRLAGKSLFSKDSNDLRITRLNRFLIPTVLLSVFMLGCGDGGPPLARVEGTVSVDGVPLSYATLTFMPESGTTSYGATDKNGKYSLMFTDTKYGAMLGKHFVEIEAAKVSKEQAAELRSQGMEVVQSNIDIPKQYKQRGALTAEVKSGKNEINFELKSK